jgi:hypothetical protein
MQAVQNYLQEQLDVMLKKLINTMSYVGVECVNHARLLPSPPEEMRKHPHAPNYIDKSGNLRGSIGFVISLDGRITGENFNGKGSRYGKEFARKIINEFPKGVALIVVAGMSYAAFVSAKGYDVLDSAEGLAIRRLPQILKQNGFIVK